MFEQSPVEATNAFYGRQKTRDDHGRRPTGSGNSAHKARTHGAHTYMSARQRFRPQAIHMIFFTSNKRPFSPITGPVAVAVDDVTQGCCCRHWSLVEVRKFAAFSGPNSQRKRFTWRSFVATRGERIFLLAHHAVSKALRHCTPTPTWQQHVSPHLSLAC